MAPRLMHIARIARLVLLVAVFSAVPASAQKNNSQSRLYAYSTLDALLAGVYDGDLTVAELSAKGDFGLGTFNHLDGEMIMLDGVCFHAKADGTVAVASPRDKTPLAYVTRFHRAPAIRPERALSLAELEKWLDAHLKNNNLFYAIRIEGVFRDVSVRAIAPQTEPYKPLAEVARTQVVHDYGETRGVLVGIRSPAFSRGISVPGYHWHFLTEDKKHGGHVLKLTVVDVSAQLEEITALDLQLPRSDAFAKADQTKDRAEEVKRVEGK
jgi:acetolactate decarboxylase